MEVIRCNYCEKFYKVIYDRYLPKRCCLKCADRKLKKIKFIIPELPKKEKQPYKYKSYRDLSEKEKEKSRKAGRKSYKKNRDKRLIYYRQLATRRKNVTGSFSIEEWKNILKNQNNLCNICKTYMKKPTIDHIIPISRWNEWTIKHPKDYLCGDIENIQALCITCNCSKHNKLPEC